MDTTAEPQPLFPLLADRASTLDPTPAEAPGRGHGRSSDPTSPAPRSREAGGCIRLLGLALAGGSVAVALGVYGRVHPPSGGGLPTLGLPSVLALKAWLATVAAVLALAQLGSALWLYGRLPLRSRPRVLAPLHRWTGTTAFLVSLPVAYHCLWALGFQASGTRQLVHSILGCAFYGAFATKLLALRSERLPRFAIPAIGSLLVCLLVGLWFTAARWFFTTVGFPA